MKIPSVANEGKKTKHIFLGVGHLIFEGGGVENSRTKILQSPNSRKKNHATRMAIKKMHTQL